MKNLQEMKVMELKEMAKELKVANWWTLKKVDLIKAIEWTQGITNPPTLILEPKAKAEPKKPEAKPEPKAEVPVNDNLITLKELIIEAGVKGTKARRILRDANIERPFKRWEWDTKEHKEILEKVRSLLKK